MAVDRKQFTELIDTGIKANADFTKFYISFKLNGNITQRTVNYSTKNWDKRTKIAQIKKKLQTLKDNQVDIGADFRDTSSLNDIANFYFDNKCNTNLKWQIERRRLYKVYFKNELGRKKVKDIRTSHIDTIVKQMQKQGKTKQTKDGCSPRTIKMVLTSALKPILQYALDNKVIYELPIINIPKQNKKKKIVNRGSEKLAILYNAIMDIFSENSFYRALFLFAMYGRRFNEIATLEWQDIDFLNSTYTIQAKNNKINQEQTYELPLPIAEALSHIKNDNYDLVFKSFITGGKISSPKRQLEKLKKTTGIKDLTMHYFRHILVSAMGEGGIAGSVLSASLGHTSLDSVNKFYLSANHYQGSKTANKAIDAIVSRKI